MERGGETKNESGVKKEEESIAEDEEDQDNEESKAKRPRTQSPGVPVVETSTNEENSAPPTIRVATAAVLGTNVSSNANAEAALVQYEYADEAVATAEGALQPHQVTTVEYVTALNEGQQIIQTETGDRYVITKDAYGFNQGHSTYGPAVDTIAIHPPPPASSQSQHEAVRQDAVQAALESAEVDKMDPIMFAAESSRDAESAAATGYESALLNDAYMQPGYNPRTGITTVSAGLESPTYTQLENAATMSSFNKGNNGSTSQTATSIVNGSVYYPSQVSYASSKSGDINSIYVVRGQSGSRLAKGGIYDMNASPNNSLNIHGDVKDQSLAWAQATSPYGTRSELDATSPGFLGNYGHYVPTAATANYPGTPPAGAATSGFIVESPEYIQNASSSTGSSSSSSASAVTCMTCQTRLTTSTWRGSRGERNATPICDQCAEYSKISNGARIASAVTSSPSTRGGSKKASSAV